MPLTIPTRLNQLSIFIDETAFAVFMNPKHPYYVRARSLFLDLDDLERDLITTNYIIYDLHEWLRNEFGYAQAEFFLRTVDKAVNSGKLTVIPGNPELETEARRLLLDYPELHYSFSEAMTAALLLSCGIKRIFTFNSHHQVLTNLDKDMTIIPSVHFVS